MLLCLTLLTACAHRGQGTLDAAAGKVGTVETVFIGTTRKQEPDGSFGAPRSETIRFAQVDVSVPPNRTAGAIR